MNNLVKKKCKAFLKNYSILAKGEGLGNIDMLLAEAGLYVAMNETPNLKRYEECRKIYRENAGKFSRFSGNSLYVLITRLTHCDDPVEYVKRLVEIRTALGGRVSNETLVDVAIIIADSVDESETDACIERTFEIYEKMMGSKKWTADENSMPFAALTAVSGRDVKEVLTEGERCREILESEDFSEPEIQLFLGRILALFDGKAEDKCKKVLDICEGLKDARHMYFPGYRYAMLGMLTGLEAGADEIVKLIVEADEALKGHKPFKGFLGMGIDARRMYAAQMVQLALRETEINKKKVDKGAELVVPKIAFLYVILYTNLFMHL